MQAIYLSLNNLHKLFQANIVIVLDLGWVFAESYVKLQYFVAILPLVTLQGSVCKHVSWSG